MPVTESAVRTPLELFDLTGRRAIVTGASRGIGQAIAVAYAAHGAQVLAVARTESGLFETQERAKDLPGSVRPLAADLSSSDGVAAAIESAASSLGGIDILVNNAGYDNEQSLEATTLPEWNKVMGLNVDALLVA
ncbi:MAG: SDR family NAD(P)-dependent oxidoreductase, partial [Kribbellaceae bacterium]|nr:SDR family NAD(P)-dependent oxidoreductase [Kribbellaceae bacterium]